MIHTQLLIAGRWRNASDGRTIDVENPSTGETIGTVAHASQSDLDEALAAAETGFRIWRATSAYDRAGIMRKAAALVRERVTAIAESMVAEQGKPLTEAKGETALAADIIEWNAGEAQRAYGRVIPARAPNILQMSLREPVGPVAAFSPWNFPVNQLVRKISAALAAGCSIIGKPPEETPESPARLVRCFTDAGVPAGVIQLVYGVPAEISAYLIPHPTIKKITFTGSTPVGKQLAALAGLHMKRATMELGGHAPSMVFDDADVDTAAKILGANKLRNAGQVCVAPTRFLVQDAVYDRFVTALTDRMARTRVGDGMDAASQMGPLANARRIPMMESLIQDAKAHGATVRTGGERIGNTGHFFQPTVLENVPPAARIMNEEPFGPVAIVNRFDTLQTVVAEANRLPYGLAAYAYTGSLRTAQALAHSIEAGMLSINHHGLAVPETPFGGIKDSGYGSEGGSEAIESYLNIKFVTQAGI